jgi:hypothetical protein
MDKALLDDAVSYFAALRRYVGLSPRAILLIESDGDFGLGLWAVPSWNSLLLEDS